MPPEVLPDLPRADPLPSAPKVASPAASPTFQGLPDNLTTIPPDTMGAVGPNHVMTALNDRIRIHDRAGVTITTMSLVAFWAATGHTDVFDPRLVYDRVGGRWVFTVTASRSSAASAFLIAASQTSDPTGPWNLYSIDADAANLVWADFPSIGFNEKWMAVQVNMFAVSGNAFTRSHIYVMNKADMYAGSALSAPVFSLTGFGGTQTPARTLTASGDLYLLQTSSGNFGGSGFVRPYRISGAIGSETLTALSFVSTPNPWSDSATAVNGGFAPQLGSSMRIASNDTRMLSVVFRNGNIWGAHTVFLPAASPTHTAVQWWQISTAGVVLQRGRIEDPTASASSGSFFAFPSLAVNVNNDMLIGYSRFGAAQFASANYSFRDAGDPANTLRDDTVLKAGLATYSKTGTGTSNRWGDYSSTVVDPVNDTDMWTIQEYADSPSDRWATWWGRIVPPSACSFSIAPTSASAVVAGVSSTVAVTAGTGCAWTAVSNTGFVSVTGGASGTANGTVSYSVATNPAPSQRVGTVTIAGHTFTVTQTAAFTDDPLVAGTTPIRAAQFNELRARIDVQLMRLDELAHGYSNAITVGGTVTAVDLLEMYAAVNDALGASPLSPIAVPPITPGMTMAVVSHINALRVAVLALEAQP